MEKTKEPDWKRAGEENPAFTPSKKRMKAVPKKWVKTNGGGNGLVTCKPEDADEIIIKTPCPIRHMETRILNVNPSRKDRPCWFWNKDTERPTIKPSIRTAGGQGELCHSFVTDGKIKFLGDCTHELAGKTVDLLDVDWYT
jgi:hypothetical protein